MQGRRERVLIPASIALTSMLVTLWASAGLTNSPFTWFPFVPGPEGKELSALLGVLAAVGITNLGIGYICQVIITFVIFWRPKYRFIDFNKLVKAFAIKIPCKLEEKQVLNILMEPLLAELHIRLHSHAPQPLIDHCSRRNSAWYIALDSIMACWLGWILAFLVMWSKVGSFLVFQRPCISQLIGFLITLLLFIFIFPYLLYKQGRRWNMEFWEVCWKWITWDLLTHPSPDIWRNDLMQRLLASANQTEARQ